MDPIIAGGAELGERHGTTRKGTPGETVSRPIATDLPCHPRPRPRAYHALYPVPPPPSRHSHSRVPVPMSDAAIEYVVCHLSRYMSR